MKYIQGKSKWNDQTEKWDYSPRVYTNFYCSLAEWAKLGRGKDNFMYQVRNQIAINRPDLWARDYEAPDKWKDESENGYYNDLFYGKHLRKLSLSRVGDRDTENHSLYSIEIIKEAIKLITNKDAEIIYHAHKGTLEYIIITFVGCNMPNIVVVINEYILSSTNYTLIKCIDCIYKTLSVKTTQYYDNWLIKYFNDKYDMVYYVSREDVDYRYLPLKEISGNWHYCFIPSKNRKYNGSEILTYSNL